MEGNDGNNKTFKILNQIIECLQAFGILALLNINERANIRTLRINTIISDQNLQQRKYAYCP